MLCRTCIVQIQLRKHVLDHADYTASTRQMIYMIQVRNHAGIGHLSDV